MSNLLAARPRRASYPGGVSGVYSSRTSQYTMKAAASQSRGAGRALEGRDPLGDRRARSRPGSTRGDEQQQAGRREERRKRVEDRAPSLQSPRTSAASARDMPQPGQGRPVVARNAQGQPGRWKSVRPTCSAPAARKMPARPGAARAAGPSSAGRPSGSRRSPAGRSAAPPPSAATPRRRPRCRPRSSARRACSRRAARVALGRAQRVPRVEQRRALRVQDLLQPVVHDVRVPALAQLCSARASSATRASLTSKRAGTYWHREARAVSLDVVLERPQERLGGAPHLRRPRGRGPGPYGQNSRGGSLRWAPRDPGGRATRWRPGSSPPCGSRAGAARSSRARAAAARGRGSAGWARPRDRARAPGCARPGGRPRPGRRASPRRRVRAGRALYSRSLW